MRTTRIIPLCLLALGLMAAAHHVAHALPFGVPTDASVGMAAPAPVMAPVTVITAAPPAPLLAPPSWLAAHWPHILAGLALWTLLASYAARKWPTPVSPPASRYAVLAHLVLIDAPSALPIREMAGIFGLPVSLPYLSLSQHPPAEESSKSITDRQVIDRSKLTALLPLLFLAPLLLSGCDWSPINDSSPSASPIVGLAFLFAAMLLHRRHHQRMVLVALLGIGMSGCAPGTDGARQAIAATEKTIAWAAAALPEFDKTHQALIVDHATSEAEGKAKLLEYRVKRNEIVKAAVTGQAVVSTAATLVVLVEQKVKPMSALTVVLGQLYDVGVKLLATVQAFMADAGGAL